MTQAFFHNTLTSRHHFGRCRQRVHAARIRYPPPHQL